LATAPRCSILKADVCCGQLKRHAARVIAESAESVP
jgi:hypothetical protein